MQDPFSWYDPAHPQKGRYFIETPKTREDALEFIAHLSRPEDRQRLTEAYDEGVRIGGMKKGLQSMLDTTTQWRQNGYVPPSEDW